MDRAYKPTIIPVYLEASSKDELIRLMFQNNVKNQKMYDYFPPIKDGRKWVVWYYADTAVDKPIRPGRRNAPES